MKLSVKERLVLLSVLPQEGDFITLKLMRKLREDLSFSEEEIKRYKFVQAENSVTWDNAVEQDKEMDFGDKQLDMIKTALKKLNDSKKLKEDHFSIYEKFVGE